MNTFIVKVVVQNSSKIYIKSCKTDLNTILYYNKFCRSYQQSFALSTNNLFI